jgi:aminocarboxymuconate-semialdehyde decarboxylase
MASEARTTVTRDVSSNDSPMENAAPIIDFHAHYMVGDILDQCHQHSPATGFGARPASPGVVRTFDNMKDPRRIIEDMDRMGITKMVLSSTTVLSPTSWAEPAVEAGFTRRLNDVIADWAADSPDRIIGSFVLPLQDMDLALKEFTRAVDDLGLRVINTPSHVRGVYLGEPAFAPFWEAVQDRGVVAFMHPEGEACEWFQKYGFWNSIGQSFEEAKFLASMIFEGMLDRFPRLKIVVTHAGGYFPHYMGRLDKNAKNMPGNMKNMTRLPSEYLRDFYYDTCVYDPSVLSTSVKILGSDRLTLGSDYSVGETDPVGFVNRCADLSAAEKRTILGETAAKLLTQ